MKKRVRTYTISAVAEMYDIHPQTLRLYEREGLLKPSRSDGNTRVFVDSDLERLEVILSLTRDLGVNLAGVEIILNMRRKIEQMQSEVNQFMEYVKRELARGIDDWEQRLGTAMVKSAPTDLVRAAYDQHLLTVPAADDTMRLLPPLNITEDEIAEAVARLDRAAASLDG